jgi:hypothetical protein
MTGSVLLLLIQKREGAPEYANYRLAPMSLLDFYGIDIKPQSICVQDELI